MSEAADLEEAYYATLTPLAAGRARQVLGRQVSCDGHPVPVNEKLEEN